MPASSTDTAVVETWHSVLDRHARVMGALEHVLAEHGLGVSEFEVLERLTTEQADGCRMHDLAGSIHLSQSALSRVVGRLEDEGLVERTMCVHDRRGIYAAITEQGRRRYEAARPAQRAVLERELG